MKTKTIKKADEIQIGDVVIKNATTTFEVLNVEFIAIGERVQVKISGYESVQGGCCGPNYFERIATDELEVEA
jgi:hypothetical protein